MLNPQLLSRHPTRTDCSLQMSQFLRFISISGLVWLMDFLLLFILSKYLTPFISNTISSTIAAAATFLISYRYVFKSKRSTVLLRLILYLVYSGLIVFVISIFFEGLYIAMTEFLVPIAWSVLLAKIFVTPFTMVLNYFAAMVILNEIK